MKKNRLIIMGAIALVLGTFAVNAQADLDRYIVQFKDNGAKGAHMALTGAGANIKLNLSSVNAVAAEIPQKALQGLRNNPNIEYIEIDPKRYPSSLRTSEHTTYGISAVQADKVSYDSTFGKKICIIDSGYSVSHPDLQGYGNITGSTGSAGVWDEDGLYHGTHVAGIISAIGGNNIGVVGVLPNANVKLHIVRVFNDAGNFSYASGLVAALDECIAVDALIVNMSLGGPIKSRSEERAFAKAEETSGVLSIAAAGNGGNKRHAYPASYDSVISVAAVDEFKAHADFSQTTNQVEISGPGVHVLSTVPFDVGAEANAEQNGVSYVGDAMEGGAIGNASGILADCGLGTNTCLGSGDFICLIQRGDITFADKVQACEDGGGAAAIIYNNVPGHLLGTLGENPLTSIPAIGVSDTVGDAMIRNDPTKVGVASSDYSFFDGTSMATPHVVGVAALVWSKHPTCSNLEIRAALTRNALDLGVEGRDDQTGHGLVQAWKTFDDIGTNGCADSGGGNNGGGGGKPCNPRKEVCN